MCLRWCQVEYYLSDENLKYDKFFHEKISENKEGWLAPWRKDEMLLHTPQKLFIAVNLRSQCGAPGECCCRPEDSAGETIQGRQQVPRTTPAVLTLPLFVVVRGPWSMDHLAPGSSALRISCLAMKDTTAHRLGLQHNAVQHVCCNSAGDLCSRIAPNLA